MSLEEDVKELRKLSPSERIKRLKELEEQKKKEIQEAEKLLKEAQTEENVEEEKKRQLPAPQMKAESLDTIETIEAKVLWAAKRGISLATKNIEVALPEEKLEETLEREKQAMPASKPYGETVEEAVKKQQRGRELVETYERQGAQPGYASMLKGPEQIYQKPDSKTDFTYETRSATPGHENKPQDFYTGEPQEKKKKSR